MYVHGCMHAADCQGDGTGVVEFTRRDDMLSALNADDSKFTSHQVGSSVRMRDYMTECTGLTLIRVRSLSFIGEESTSMAMHMYTV
jgi:hypothetical protein